MDVLIVSTGSDAGAGLISSERDRGRENVRLSSLDETAPGRGEWRSSPAGETLSSVPPPHEPQYSSVAFYSVAEQLDRHQLLIRDERLNSRLEIAGAEARRKMKRNDVKMEGQSFEGAPEQVHTMPFGGDVMMVSVRGLGVEDGETAGRSAVVGGHAAVGAPGGAGQRERERERHVMMETQHDRFTLGEGAGISNTYPFPLPHRAAVLSSPVGMLWYAEEINTQPSGRNQRRESPAGYPDIPHSPPPSSSSQHATAAPTSRIDGTVKERDWAEKRSSRDEELHSAHPQAAADAEDAEEELASIEASLAHVILLQRERLRAVAAVSPSRSPSSKTHSPYHSRKEREYTLEVGQKNGSTAQLRSSRDVSSAHPSQKKRKTKSRTTSELICARPYPSFPNRGNNTNTANNDNNNNNNVMNKNRHPVAQNTTISFAQKQKCRDEVVNLNSAHRLRSTTSGAVAISHKATDSGALTTRRHREINVKNVSHPVNPNLQNIHPTQDEKASFTAPRGSSAKRDFQLRENPITMNMNATSDYRASSATKTVISPYHHYAAPVQRCGEVGKGSKARPTPSPLGADVTNHNIDGVGCPRAECDPVVLQYWGSPTTSLDMALSLPSGTLIEVKDGAAVEVAAPPNRQCETAIIADHRKEREQSREGGWDGQSGMMPRSSPCEAHSDTAHTSLPAPSTSSMIAQLGRNATTYGTMTTSSGASGGRHSRSGITTALSSDGNTSTAREKALPNGEIPQEQFMAEIEEFENDAIAAAAKRLLECGTAPGDRGKEEWPERVEALVLGGKTHPREASRNHDTRKNIPTSLKRENEEEEHPSSRGTMGEAENGESPRTNPAATPDEKDDEMRVMCERDSASRFDSVLMITQKRQEEVRRRDGGEIGDAHNVILVKEADNGMIGLEWCEATDDFLTRAIEGPEEASGGSYCYREGAPTRVVSIPASVPPSLEAKPSSMATSARRSCSVPSERAAQRHKRKFFAHTLDVVDPRESGHPKRLNRTDGSTARPSRETPHMKKTDIMNRERRSGPSARVDRIRSTAPTTLVSSTPRNRDTRYREGRGVAAAEKRAAAAASAPVPPTPAAVRAAVAAALLSDDDEMFPNDGARKREGRRPERGGWRQSSAAQRRPKGTLRAPRESSLSLESSVPAPESQHRPRCRSMEAMRSSGSPPLADIFGVSSVLAEQGTITLASVWSSHGTVSPPPAPLVKWVQTCATETWPHSRLVKTECSVEPSAHRGKTMTEKVFRASSQQADANLAMQFIPAREDSHIIHCGGTSRRQPSSDPHESGVKLIPGSKGARDRPLTAVDNQKKKLNDYAINNNNNNNNNRRIATYAQAYPKVKCIGKHLQEESTSYHGLSYGQDEENTHCRSHRAMTPLTSKPFPSSGNPSSAVLTSKSGNHSIADKKKTPTHHNSSYSGSTRALIREIDSIWSVVPPNIPTTSSSTTATTVTFPGSPAYLSSSYTAPQHLSTHSLARMGLKKGSLEVCATASNSF